MSTPADPRPAATLMLLRRAGDGSDGLEVLMTRRSPEARVMPGIWVFPGGSVDPEDFDDANDEHHAYELAARRELAEEAAIELAPADEVRPWSRWVTPEVVPVRFDTCFFVAEAPRGAEPVADGVEMTDARWLAPRSALDSYEAGKIDLIFPTIMHLLMLARHSRVESVLEAAPPQAPDPIEPEIIEVGDEVRIRIGSEEYPLPRTAALEVPGA